MYIVTGGAGFIGSAVVARLNAEGITNILIVDNLRESEKWKNLVGLQYTDYVHKDDFIISLLNNELQMGIKGIVHMGASSSTTELDMDYLMDNNFRYSKELASYSLENNIRFIYASSAATYGAGERGYKDDEEELVSLRPLNRYGYSKQLFDLWAWKQRVLDRIVGLKFFNVYGPNEHHKGEQRSVVAKAYEQAKQDGVIRLFSSYRDEFADGEQKRDFVYIKDCVDLVWELLQKPEVNGIYNVGSGQARTWNDLAKAVFSALGIAPKIEYMDMPESLRDHYQYFTEADMKSLAKAGCSWSPVSLEEGVADYVKNYLERGHYLSSSF